MKKFLFFFGIVTTLVACDKSQVTHLEAKIDSLAFVLNESKKAEAALNEVGLQLDSIDVSRKALHTNIVEGITYADYIGRLKEINLYIKDANARIDALEAKTKIASGISAATIRRLRADLKTKSAEIVLLQLDVVALREQNGKLASNIKLKDSVISANEEIIKMRNENVTALEGLVIDINDQNRIKVAGLYYDQAQALETAANRTKFAPRKRKQTRMEALELYKLAFSMGNVKAGERVQELEKKLS